MRGLPTVRVMRRDQHHGAEGATVTLEARAEVSDLDAAALAVVQSRDQDGGVLAIVLFAMAEVVEFHAEIAEVILAAAFAQQGAEHRIAVEAGHAGPDDFPFGIDQCADAAVAYQSQIECIQGVSFQFLLAVQDSSSCAKHAVRAEPVEAVHNVRLNFFQRGLKMAANAASTSSARTVFRIPRLHFNFVRHLPPCRLASHVPHRRWRCGSGRRCGRCPP